jgi:SAM-dependent methyltransferase
LEGVRVTDQSDDRYLLPRDMEEIDRLDLQHYAFLEALGGLHRAPARVEGLTLDAGAGSGRWGWDLVQGSPEARVVGLDLMPGRAGWPERYQPLRANVLDGLPFADDSFDFVHQRMMLFSIPERYWHVAIHDLVRVTRPGGWVELVEMPVGAFENAGPMVRRIADLALAGAAARGLDTSGTPYRMLDHYLGAVGCEEVERVDMTLPIGDWGGRVGSILATDFRLVSARILEAFSDLNAEQQAETLRLAHVEFEQRRVTIGLALAFGRKPARV